MAFDLSKYTTRTAENFNSPFYIYGNRLVQGIAKFYMKVVAKTKVYGLDNVPKDHTRFILASNHSSNLDPFLVGSTIPGINTAFLAKKELLEDWRTRYIMELSCVIAVDREKIGISTIRSAKTALNSKGWCLGIFPEGTRRKGDEAVETKKGVGFFAKTTKTPVLPVGITMSGPGNRNIVMIFGELIPYEGQDITAYSELVMTHIEALKERAEIYAKQDF